MGPPLSRNADYVTELAPCFDTQRHRSRDGIFQDRDFSEVIRVAPDRIGSGREKGQVPHPITVFHPFFVGHKTFAGENDVRLVLAVVPFVACASALPKDGVCKSISRRAENFAASFRLSAQHPLRRDCSGFKLGVRKRIQYVRVEL